MRRQNPRALAVLSFVIATINFSTVARRPDFAVLSTVTCVQLVAAGMMLGIGLVLLFRQLKER